MKRHSPVPGGRSLAAAAALAALLTAGAGIVRAEEPGDARRGLAYAETHCAECHAVTSRPEASPVARATPFTVVAATPGITSTALLVWLVSPHPTMPNLIVPAESRDDVIAYILSLKPGK